MLAQILICDQVEFLPESKQFTLGKVINAIDIPTLPYVSKLPIFIKLFDIPTDRTVDMHFEVRTAGGKVLAVTAPTILRNYRQADQVPGVDTSIRLTVVTCQPETLAIVLFIDGEEVSTYPLTIRLQSERIGA